MNRRKRPWAELVAVVDREVDSNTKMARDTKRSALRELVAADVVSDPENIPPEFR